MNSEGVYTLRRKVSVRSKNLVGGVVVKFVFLKTLRCTARSKSIELSLKFRSGWERLQRAMNGPNESSLIA